MGYNILLNYLSEAASLEQTVAYLTQQCRQFLRRSDQVMICFPTDSPDSLGTLFAEATRRCGAVPVIWGPDLRWKSLLRQAFYCRAGTIIGPPLVILGLTKLSRAKATPLYIRNVVTAGYCCTDWMIDGIKNGLDCKSWGCLDWQLGSVAAGFSCGAGRGVHLRDDQYGVRILDEGGREVPAGEIGELYLYHKKFPQILLPTMDRACLDPSRCSCGLEAPLLTNITPGTSLDEELIRLAETINQWSSVLDCRIIRGPLGLEIEIVVFPGEKLPRLPSCARLTVRPWDPEKDEPFWHSPVWKSAATSAENH